MSDEKISLCGWMKLTLGNDTTTANRPAESLRSSETNFIVFAQARLAAACVEEKREILWFIASSTRGKKKNALIDESNLICVAEAAFLLSFLRQ